MKQLLENDKFEKYLFIPASFKNFYCQIDI